MLFRSFCIFRRSALSQHEFICWPSCFCFCDSVFTVSLVDFLDFGNFLPIMVSPAFIHACLMLFHASCAVSFFFDSDVRPSSNPYGADNISLFGQIPLSNFQCGTIKQNQSEVGKFISFLTWLHILVCTNVCKLELHFAGNPIKIWHSSSRDMSIQARSENHYCRILILLDYITKWSSRYIRPIDFKEILSDSNNILMAWIRRYKRKKKKKKKERKLSKFKSIPILRFQVMHDYVSTAPSPIDPVLAVQPDHCYIFFL